MELTSDSFRDQMRIPTRHTCDGDGVSPQLRITAVPPGTETLALVVEDPDAPAGTWYHWVAYNIPVADAIPEGVAGLGTAGRNSWGRTGYGAPCPPRGSHRYFFTVYALDTHLGLKKGAARAELQQAMRGHVLAAATLLGRYSR